jgi:hypothetical protein
VWRKITRVVMFLNIVSSSKCVSLVFMFVTASEMKIEIPSEIKTVTAQSCRTGKRITVM